MVRLDPSEREYDDPPARKRQANHLMYEKSPYLIQHAYNPVDWYPWGVVAFERAIAEDKPVFLSIGYATCHWCAGCQATGRPSCAVNKKNRIEKDGRVYTKKSAGNLQVF